MAVSVIGTYMMVRLDVHSTNTDVLIAMLVLGFGMGFGMALYTLIVQNALPKKIGQATSALVFFRQIGGTIGLAAMGSVMTSAYLPAFQNALPATVKQAIPAKFLAAFNNPQILLSPDALSQMQSAAAKGGPQAVALLNQVIEAVRIGLAQGIHNVFVLSLVIMILGLISVFFIKEIALKGKKNIASGVVEGMEDAAPEHEGVMATMM